jgi:hypothetical protein
VAWYCTISCHYIFQDVLWETAKGSGSESTSTLEEVTEDMEKEMEEDDEADEDEQLIRLFMAEEGRRRERRKRRSAAAAVQEQHHHKELFALCRRHGCRRIAHARKHHTRTDNQEVQKAAKLHRQLAAVQRRRRRQAADKKRVSVSDIFQDAIAMKMFMSVLDPEDILEDWNWNLDEAPSTVEEAEDWEWNLLQETNNMPKDDDNSTGIKQCYYDVPSVKDDFNDFNFWRNEAELVHLLPVEEDAWPLWKEWGSVNEILANTLEAELLLAEVESGEEVQECPPPWTGRQEEFRLPMTRMAARGSSRCRHLEEEDDHWSLWTEWGSVDEILDNTLVAGLADLDDDAVSAAAPEEQCPPEKDEDVDSGFLGDTEEDWGKWTMTATTATERQSFWQDSYDNESILHSLVNDEMIEEAGGASGGEIGSYWDESRRDNHRILEALLYEEPSVVAGGRKGDRRKRKFREEETDTDEDIVFEEDQEKERDAQPIFSKYEDGSGDHDGGGNHQTHQFWEAFSKNKNNNNAMFEECRTDSEERDLCSCESGVFWLSTEDNRRIAENLVEEPATAYWEASLENSRIARALVGEVAADSGATAEREKQPRKEAEDYFKDWRRNLISPRKSR